RRHARRRGGDRALGADGLRAAVLRRSRRQPRHAVRQGRRRGGGTGEVRLPGLRTLTIIDRAVALINRDRAAGSSALEVSALPTDDAATYALLKTTRTTAVFQ